MTYILIIFLILLSALFSGLTLGLMGLDVFDLKRKMELGSIDAKRVYEIRRKGNLLLATLLLGNIAVTSTISIILEGIAGGLVAGIVATGTIFIFGEVIPQSIIPRYALKFGSFTAPITKTLIFIFFPICFPVSYVLDKFLGSELPTIYSKNEIEKIVAEHEDHPSSPIDADEKRIIHGALQFSDKKVSDIMTKIDAVIMVNKEDILSPSLLEKLNTAGRSRFPVLNSASGKIEGILYIKDLVGVGFDGTKKVSDFYDPEVVFRNENSRLDNVLNNFLDKRKHLFVVQDENEKVKGVVSMEDIIEEILKREIIDESEK